MMNTPITDSEAWKALVSLAKSHATPSLVERFQQDPQRFNRYTLEVDDLFLDYSKNLVDDDILAKLTELAKEAGLEQARTQLLQGDNINNTEHRPALHTALRDRSFLPLMVDGKNIMEDIRALHHKMQSISEKVRTQQWWGYSGKSITDIVNIGIGGSHLGPEMVTKAFSHLHSSNLNFHFVSNVDFNDLEATLKRLKSETTLFIVSSKSFTTQETLTNALEAKKWLLSHSRNEASISRHFLAITSKPDAAVEFGIHPDNVFPMWDWVGGRYSLWSAIGLPIVLAIGMHRFEQLLAGAHEMDRHFANAPLEQNMPVLMAMLGIWYNNFLGVQEHALLPYCHNLSSFPDYMQQCDMESNGKSVTREGLPVNTQTGPVIWGGVGTNSQHAFFQLLHQGTHWVPADFIGVVHPHHRNSTQHKMLLANLLAQTEALMVGKSADQAYQEMLDKGMNTNEAEQLKAHRAFSGNRPSSTLLMNKLSPFAMGQLIALYEHKVFCQGIIWGINSFDQWGVELGKQLSVPILNELMDANTPLEHDPSTNGLINRVREKLNENSTTGYESESAHSELMYHENSRFFGE